MKLSSKIIAPAVIVIIFGGIAISAGLNLWNTQSNKTPMRYGRGAYVGQYNPADIRGSYSFADVERAFGLAPEVLASAFGFEDQKNPELIRAKDLEGVYGPTPAGEIGTDSLRYFVSLYTGLPYTPEEDTRLLTQAVSILSDRLDTDQTAELDRRIIDFSGPIGEITLDAEHTEDSDERIVKGKTTFADLTGWGLSEEEIEGVIGMKMGRPGVTVRDHLAGQGLSFGQIKNELQRLLDSAE
jgi:hypothetical protein